MSAPRKVAIIGGGCASMAAAFELTRPELAGQFEVTVYQLGWRLGGKGASGRGVCDRIEEHGLHLWMGFYENAFRLMRECYAELDRDPRSHRIAGWRDAFSPCSLNAVADQAPDGAWLEWRVLFPDCPGLPGEPPSDESRWTLGKYLARCLLLLRALFDSLATRQHPEAAASGAEGVPSNPAELVERVARVLAYGRLGTVAAIREALRLLDVAARWLPELPGATLLGLHGLLKQAAEAELERLADSDPALRRLWEIVDLVLAVVRGFISERLIFDERGLDAIDDYDCREWLRLHGASQRALDSGFVRGLYDLAFAYAGGDVERPSIAAGQAIRGALRAFFTYRGAFFWKMHAGMGDAVFAPLYEVLARRGVRFAFFHRLLDVRLGAAPGKEPGFVAALDFERQARTLHAGYAPLVDVRGLPCWPSEPLYEQLVGGERLRESGHDLESFEPTPGGERIRLELGVDFDLVVLGVGVGAIGHVSRDLVEHDPAWRAMVRHAASVPTQALQLWLSRGFDELGRQGGPINLSGFVSPFDTWADMTHVAREESWPEPPRAIAYFCSVLPDAPARAGAGVAERHEEVFENARRFLARDVGWLWPHAQTASGEFDWELLVLPPGAPPCSGEARLRAQYHRANVHPVDRYAQSLPGSLQFRISPLDPSYDNLSVCGDFTSCGFNEGCVEAAVMSGKLAAHALSGSPALREIVGYDHP